MSEKQKNLINNPNSFFRDTEKFTGKSVNDLDEIYDKAFSSNGGTGYTSALNKTLHGIKITGAGVILAPIADDTIGLVFISRPLLNLSDENCKGPRFSKFYKTDKKSMLNYVRGLLDRKVGETHCHPSLNNKNPWMVPLTNLLLTSDGFADLSLEVKTTNPGLRQEVHHTPVGLLDDNGDGSINMSFRNVKPGVIIDIFENWISYIPEVKLGDNQMDPYWDALRQNYNDWDCRVYHFILNSNAKNIERCIMTGSTFPYTFPQGSLFRIDNQSAERRAVEQDTLSIGFKRIAGISNFIEVASSFNDTTYYFNDDLRPENRNSKYIKLDQSELIDYGNYEAIPLINMETCEFEWYVPKDKIKVTNNG